MSDGGPFGEGFPGFDPSQLARMFSGSGPVNWEVAKMAAAQVGVEAGNVDPLRRIRLEELLRVAELHIGQATGLSTSTTGRLLSVRAVNPSDWASATLEAWKPYLERLAVALTPSASPPGEGDGAASDPANPFARLFEDLPRVLTPMLLGFQSGMLVAQLASRAFGQYDLPLPRPAGDELLVVPSHLDAFAADWSLPADDVSLWVCLSEIAHHAVLGVPHVRTALTDRILDHVGGFRPDPAELGERLGGLDPMDPETMERVFSNPEQLLGAMRTPEQEARLPHLHALLAAVEGYVDHILDTTGHGLVGSFPQLTEALRRRRLEETQTDRFIGHLLGIQLGEADYARGAAFVRGVLERAGRDGLDRLWSAPDTLPTPAEVDAPGLWLARIDL